MTIFDKRKIWLKPIVQDICIDSRDAACDSVESNVVEYELNSYTATIRHGLLSIRNIQKLVYTQVNCYKDQVLVVDIRGGYAHIDIYVKRWGLALIQGALNHIFNEVQHRMIEEMMRHRIDKENYNKIDEIFERVLRDL